MTSELNKEKVADDLPSGAVTIHVQGQGAMYSDPPTYSNYLAVARVGADVQFEFIFLDFNTIAQILDQSKKGVALTLPVEGRTVAKIIVSGVNLIQIRNHLNFILDETEKAVKGVKTKNGMEAQNDSNNVKSS